MSGSGTKRQTYIQTVDPLWEAVRAAAQEIVRSEPSLSGMAVANILNHDSFESALAHRLAARLNHTDVSADLLRQTFGAAC